MSVLDLAIDVLAATRLTRLVIEDTFPPVKAARDAIVDSHSECVPVFQDFERDQDDGTVEIERKQIGTREKLDSWAELITCPWCAGAWCCMFVVCARQFAPKAWHPVAKALAMSMVVGLVETKVDVG